MFAIAPSREYGAADTLKASSGSCFFAKLARLFALRFVPYFTSMGTTPRTFSNPSKMKSISVLVCSFWKYQIGLLVFATYSCSASCSPKAPLNSRKIASPSKMACARKPHIAPMRPTSKPKTLNASSS